MIVPATFEEIIKRKARNVPGRLQTVAEYAGISQTTLYNRLSGNTTFNLEELRGMDRVLHFTEAEKASIWN